MFLLLSIIQLFQGVCLNNSKSKYAYTSGCIIGLDKLWTATSALIKKWAKNAGQILPPFSTSAAHHIAIRESGQIRVSVTVERDARLDAAGTSGIYPVPPLLAGDGLSDGSARMTFPSTGEAGLHGDFACLSVEDDGSEMTAEFIKERLFRPFDTTKGSKGMGIGAYQVREYVRSIGGRVKVDSVVDPGSRFTIWLPCTPPGEASQA